MMPVLVGDVARQAKIKVLTVVACYKRGLGKDYIGLVGQKYAKDGAAYQRHKRCTCAWTW